MKVELINNNSGFSCTGCIYDTSGHGCGITLEALNTVGDCDVNTVFKEVEDDTTK